MDNKDKLILEMLRNEKSYTDIQSELNVSPSRIAKVKKQYSNTTSSTNDALLRNNNDTTLESETEFKSSSDSFKKENESEKEIIIPKKENPEIILDKYKEELKNFIKDTIATSFDNSTTHDTTTIKNEEKTVADNEQSRNDNIENTTEKINTITENSTDISKDSREAYNYVGQECYYCGKKIRKGMNVLYSEEEGIYFCSKKCYYKSEHE